MEEDEGEKDQADPRGTRAGGRKERRQKNEDESERADDTAPTAVWGLLVPLPYNLARQSPQLLASQLFLCPTTLAARTNHAVGQHPHPFSGVSRNVLNTCIVITLSFPTSPAKLVFVFVFAVRLVASAERCTSQG